MSFKRKFISAAAILLLSACGGGDQDVDTMEAAVGEEVEAVPAFHTSPLVLEDPKLSGQHLLGDGNGTQYRMSKQLDAVDTRNLTGDGIEAANEALRARALSNTLNTGTRTLRVYNPAQIRAIYGLPPIPADLSNLTPEQAADLGAGQTIYILTAFDAPNVLADLKRFNDTFGLPQCRYFDAGTSGGPLPPAPMNECTISIVNVKIGRVVSQKFKYNNAWAKEATMDIQWAHATAPLARIVLLQGINNFVNTFADSLNISARMGPGAVSMSFVAGEMFTYTEKYEVFFRGNGMTYLAASGDWGYQGNWPATSPNVLAIGGTTLNGMTNGVRQEVAWSKTGGGYSQYFPAPTYQTGLPDAPVTTVRRAVNKFVKPRSTSDIAFNADPYTGQFTVFTPLGRSPTWYSMGGTSIGTPQIAGLVTIANAHRVLNGKQHVGKFHPKLYSEMGPGVGAMTNTFVDVKGGKNGNCSLCTAGDGYDLPTGWGTPNSTNFVNVLKNL